MELNQTQMWADGTFVWDTVFAAPRAGREQTITLLCACIYTGGSGLCPPLTEWKFTRMHSLKTGKRYFNPLYMENPLANRECECVVSSTYSASIQQRHYSHTHTHTVAKSVCFTAAPRGLNTKFNNTF